MPRQRVPHIGADAVDMDMQLVLGAAGDGVDGEAEILPRQDLAQPGIDKGRLPPGFGEVVGRARREQRGALDTGDARGGDQQILRLADDILEDGVARGEIDLRARRRETQLRLVHHAAAMDDLPEDIRVGRGAEEDDGQEGGNHRQAGDHALHPVQPVARHPFPHGHPTSADPLSGRSPAIGPVP